MPYKNETELSNKIKELFKSWGEHAKSVKIVASMGQESGIPDRLNIVNGRVVFCEAKIHSPFVKAGRPTDLQYSFMRKWINAGGEACCIRCIEDVVALFSGSSFIWNFEVIYDLKEANYIHHGYVKDAKHYQKFLDTIVYRGNNE